MSKFNKKLRIAHNKKGLINETSKCAKCGETRFLTVEHIVPIHLIVEFVLEEEFVKNELNMNLEILCKWCNVQKGGKIDVRNPKTFEVLRYIIARCEQELSGTHDIHRLGLDSHSHNAILMK